MHPFVKKVIRKTKNTLGLYTAPNGVLILMYHRVNDELPAHELIVRTRDFEQQMRFIYENPQIYQIVSVKELEDNRPRIFNARFPKTKLIITFDDGYRDNFTNAFPILRKYKFPASVFLPTGVIGTEKKFQRYETVEGRDMLRWEEIAKMSRHRITFGPHTVNHPHLPQLSLAEQKREIEESRDCINEHLSKEERLNTFCYPYGEYNEDTLKIVQDLDFQYAVTVKQGFNTPYTPLYELKRIEVRGPDSIKSFEYKVLEKFLNTEEDPYVEY